MKIAPLGPHTSTETGENSHERSGDHRAVPALPAGDRPGRGGRRDAQARPAGRDCCAPPRGGRAEALFIPGPPRAGRAVGDHTGHPDTRIRSGGLVTHGSLIFIGVLRIYNVLYFLLLEDLSIFLIVFSGLLSAKWAVVHNTIEPALEVLCSSKLNFQFLEVNFQNERTVSP